MAIDVTKFRPESAKELFEGLLSVVKDVVVEQWTVIKAELNHQFKFIAESTLKVASKLAAKIISDKEADATLHLLEINLNSALKEFVFLTYVATQKILNAVFNLLKNVIRNVAGVALQF